MTTDNKILDELKKATEKVQVIASMEAKQRSEYLEAVSKQFFELQKTVHSIIREEGIILNNFKWKSYMTTTDLYPNEYISRIAKLFANKYGFNEEVVLDLFMTKNKGYVKKSWGDLYYYTLVPKE